MISVGKGDSVETDLPKFSSCFSRSISAEEKCALRHGPTMTVAGVKRKSILSL